MTDNKKIKAPPTHGTPKTEPVKNVGNASTDIIPQNSEKSIENAKFSLSDSDGKQLTAEGEAPKTYGNYNVYGKDIKLEKAPTQNDISPIASGKAKERISIEDFANRDSSVWRNVEYNDTETKARIMQETHDKMLSEGAIVKVSDDVVAKVESSFPNVRDMKKRERVPILKEAMNKLKINLWQFLNSFKNQNFEFEVNGRVLDAKLYSTGINEVLEKITQQKANMLYSTEDIFNNAQYLYSTPDYDGDPNVYRWNYFYTPVQIGEETVGVRIAVRDLAKQGESQIYNWGIKKDTSLGGVRDDLTNRKSYDASSDVSEDIIAENSKIVKLQNEIVSEDISPITEEEANAMASESLDSLTDADVPPEFDSPYYGEEAEAAPDDPFENRDIKEVGNRKVKAYMYENPEVKPFFQAEARTMLGDLERGIKGERYYVETPEGSTARPA